MSPFPSFLWSNCYCFLDVAIADTDLQWAPFPQLMMTLRENGGDKTWDGQDAHFLVVCVYMLKPKQVLNAYGLIILLYNGYHTGTIHWQLCTVRPTPLCSTQHSIKGINFDTPVFSIQPLPGREMHSYVLPGAAWEEAALRGALVSTIPFTHPAHVPALLELLRHQCAINTLLASCITSHRPSPGKWATEHTSGF